MSETKIDAFVRRLNESPKKLASGPFRSEAWRYLHHIYSGDHVAGIIHEDGRLTIMAPIGTGAFVLLHETWRSLGAPPEIPPRVQRFLEALDREGVLLMHNNSHRLRGPYTTTPNSIRRTLAVFACGVEVGEIHGATLSIDGRIAVQDRMILDYLWRETEQDALKANS